MQITQPRITDSIQYNWFTRANPLLIKFSVFLLDLTLIISTVSLTNLTNWRLAQVESTILKFSPLVLLIAAAFICIPDLSLNRFVRGLLSTISANWYITLFTTFALLGSTYARFSLDLETSYFTQAAMSLAFYFAYFIFVSIPDANWPAMQKRMINVVSISTAVAGFAVLVNSGQIFFFESSGLERSNHETAFLLVQAISIVLYCVNTFFLKVSLLGLIVLLTALALKNTAFLTLVITVFFIFFIPSGREKRFFQKVVIALLLLIVGVITYNWVEPYLSDGNTYFRTTIYQYRFNQFLSSPIYGELFVGETALHYERTLHASEQLIVPTHNDLLDVIVQGGLISFIAFMGAFLHIAFKLLRLRFRSNFSLGNIDKAILTWTFLFIINELVVMAFNPMLGSTDIAYIMWVILAFTQRNISYTQNKVLSKPL